MSIASKILKEAYGQGLVNKLTLDTDEVRKEGGQTIIGVNNGIDLNYYPNKKHFIIARTGLAWPKEPITVTNNNYFNKDSWVKPEMKFKFVSTDYDSTHDHILSWNYVCQSEKGNYTLEVYNDDK